MLLRQLNITCKNIIKHTQSITFLPLSILYQFNNYFNIFFLLTAVILAIPAISPIDPFSSIFPFLFVIMISIVREFIEDNVSNVKNI